MSDLCGQPATQLRRAIATGDVSPVELLESCIARIEELNPTVNAIVATCFERARSEASAAERAVRSGENIPPLHGLPVAIKDLVATEGMPTTYGSPLYADNVPNRDAGLVKRLRDAGAIVVGKTNTPEFGAGTNTSNRVYGATRNPHALERTCGGSSGGAAAALACDMVPLAHGSDTGGSLRNPATWCGVVGFRPTPGLVPHEARNVNYSHFAVQGPMARTVPDIALMLMGLAGNDPNDPLSGPVSTSAFENLADADLSNLRVATSEDLGLAPVDDEIRDVFRARIGSVSGAFAACEQRNPELAGAREIFWALRSVTFLANHGERYREHGQNLAPNVVANVEAALAMTPQDMAEAEHGWARLYRAFQDFFKDIDLLIVPGNATSAFRVEDGIPKVVGGRKMENYMDASILRSALTLTGHPIVALPMGIDALGMPFGVQIVGPRRGDAFLLSAAAALEKYIATLPDLVPPRLNLEDLKS
ncbi:MAG: amidase family protein [Hyphomicrobiaceae bacterium]|nr:amidase family protein [Hyphomicrobiaceae bacterium]